LSPSPEHVEYAAALLRSANDRLYACRVLAEATDIEDGAVGFCAQQAVEKALKAAIVLAEVELPHTHDLSLLRERIEASDTKLPDELASVDWLTPWEAAMRYDEPTGLDRAAALAAAERACSWATALLGQP
jgi:HEPN domain-containing protein